MNRVIIGVIAVVSSIACSDGGPSEPLKVETIDITPAATEVAPGTTVALVPKLIGGTIGETKYRWSIAEVRCQKGLKVTDKAITEFLAPPECKGRVSINLIVQRAKEQVEAGTVLHVADRPSQVVAGGDSVPPVQSPKGDSFALPFERVFQFQDESGKLTATFTKKDDTLSVLLASPTGQGFGGVCIQMPAKYADMSAFSTLEFEATVREGRNFPLHVKFEKIDSSCPKCMCFLHDKPADELPGAATGRIRLSLSGCRDILGQIARLCFATNTMNWTGPGRLQADIRNVRFVK